jgi:hypothetical protein
MSNALARSSFLSDLAEGASRLKRDKQMKGPTSARLAFI